MSDNTHRRPDPERRATTDNTVDYYAYHDPESDARLSTTLVHALADVMGVDVTDSGFVLAEEIDPEALDNLFAPPAGDETTGHVAFRANSYRVTVYSNGKIVITPPRSEQEA